MAPSGRHYYHGNHVHGGRAHFGDVYKRGITIIESDILTAIDTKGMFEIQGLPHLMTTPTYTPTMPWVPYLPMSIDRVSESK